MGGGLRKMVWHRPADEWRRILEAKAEGSGGDPSEVGWLSKREASSLGVGGGGQVAGGKVDGTCRGLEKLGSKRTAWLYG